MVLWRRRHRVVGGGADDPHGAVDTCLFQSNFFEAGVFRKSELEPIAYPELSCTVELILSNGMHSY